MGRTSKQTAAGQGFTFTTGPTITFLPSDPGATLNVRTPDGSGGVVSLKTRTSKTTNSIVNFGGLFEKVDLLVGELNLFTTSAGDKAYYLNGVGLTATEMDLLGIRIPSAKVVVDGLTNHPAIANTGSWIGKVTMSGTGLEIAAIPALKFAPTSQKPGDPALQASYNFNTKQVEAAINNVTYTSNDINLAVGGTVKISPAKNAGTASETVSKLEFNGQGSVSLPVLGLEPVSGSVQFVLENDKMQSMIASLSTTQSINNWKIAGDLKLNHNFIDQSGSVELSSATIYSIGAKGLLNYDNKGVNGNVTLSNTVKGRFNYGSFAFTPYEGTLAYSYDALLKSVSLDFRNVKFGVTLFDKEAIFNGSLSLSIATATGAVSFKSADLALANDIAWTFDGTTNSGKETIVLTLQANGTVPTKIEWKKSVYDAALEGELDESGQPRKPQFGNAITFNGSVKVKAPFVGNVEGYVKDLQYAWNEKIDNWSVAGFGFATPQSSSISQALKADQPLVQPQFLSTPLDIGADFERLPNSLPWLTSFAGITAVVP
jgi:hypothetical protein